MSLAETQLNSDLSVRQDNPREVALTVRFPSPWSVEITEGGHLVVRDLNGLALAFVYVRGPGRNGLTSSDALMIAESIARLGDAARG
jgi:hypothetical protein